MSEILDSSTWEPVIYQIAKEDLVLGGAPIIEDNKIISGVANIAPQQLANRTNYLKDRADAADTSIDTLNTQVSTTISNIATAAHRLDVLEPTVASITANVVSATDDARVSAGAAATSATAAGVSANQAAASAATAIATLPNSIAAAASATAAATSATAAAASATAADISATSATTSKNAAATSATAAAASQSDALSSATNANASKSAAATYVTNAAGSATAAAGSASDASTSATSATTSKNAAATSATNAATSATNASTSATAAATSATAAAASQTAAAASQLDAAASKTAASTSATAALSSANNAAASQTAAGVSATAAAASQTAAAGSATTASTNATNAVSAAAGASTSATAAAGSATAAAGSATTASNAQATVAASATSAATSATNASNSATAASTSQTAAGVSATAAAGSATAATTSATSAATSATNASNSATAATTSATSAATSATNASNSATAASTSQTAAATSATNAATSETNAAASQTAAATSATSAANSVTSSGVNATNAGNSATAAATSATAAANSAAAALAATIQHYRGYYTTLAALTSGATSPIAGDYADVDAGTGSNAVQYIWDTNDNVWVPATASTLVTASQVKSLYESNLNTNAYTDVEKTKLGSIDMSTKLDATANAVSATKLVTPRNINGVPFDGTANITVADSTKEPAITGGTSSQFWSGTKVWTDFATTLWGTVLTGLSTATSTVVTAADTVLVGIGKLQAQITTLGTSVGSKLSLTGGTLTGVLNESTVLTIASAATLPIGATASNTINISGTTTITGFDTIAAGAVRRLVFQGILTLTHNSVSSSLPGGVNITTAAGDIATFVSLGGGNWKCVEYVRSSVSPDAITRLASPRNINGVAFDGTANITVADSTKEPAITGGTSSQFWNGAKAWVDFATTVWGTVLTGLSTATSTVVTATDTVLVGIGKLQAQITTLSTSDAAKLPLAGGTLTGAINEAPFATLASASTVAISTAAANTINITGTTTITGFDTLPAGSKRTIVFVGSLILTHSGTFSLLTSANITTAAGDIAEFESTGGGSWTMIDYARKSGVPLVVTDKTVAVAASNIDCSLGSYFTKTITGITTLTISNPPVAGTSSSIVLELVNGGAFTVTWFTGIKWASGAAPTLTASGTDIIGFYTLDGGTTWRGFVMAKDSK